MDKVQEVTEALLQKGSEDGLITLSSGVRIRARGLPRFRLRKVYDQHPAPEVPIIEFEQGGKMLTQENPNDPDYREALQEHNEEVGQIFLNLLMLRGMDIVFVPEGIPDQDDEFWHQELELYGDEVPRPGPMRLLAWLEDYAIIEEGDLERIQEAVLSRSGVGEAAVSEAMKSFRREMGGDSAPEEEAESLGPDGETGDPGPGS